MKKLSFVFFTIFLLGLASAISISEEYDTNVIIKDLDTPIKLTLTITNAPTGSYNLYTLSDISITPSEIFNIEGGGIVKEFTLKSTDYLKDTNGYYTFTYTLHRRGVEQIDRKFTIKLTNLEDAIEIINGSADYETGEIIFYIRNKENISLNKLSGRFSSLLFSDIKEEFDLEPFEEYKIKIIVDKEDLERTKAGNYIITSIFETVEGESKIEGKLFLGEKKGISTDEDRFGILIKNYIITKTNAGNTVENIEITVEKNILSRLFTSFNIKPNLVEREGLSVKYKWIKNRFEPGEIFTLRVRTNYLIPLVILIVLVVAYFGVKKYTKTKVEVKKSVSPVKTKNDEFALKIKISVKAKNNVENVTLIDQVPPMVKVYNKFGTSKPNKVDVSSRRIHWTLGDLDEGEERIFSYIVYSKVGVVGKFSLPEAMAVFEKDGEIYEVTSKKVFFMSEQVSKNK
ncbi:MAG: hypothetical protein WC494_00100 [Candidatus Pacearchaeota archaeon]